MRRNKGFTLVEILVVITIIGIISTVMAGRFISTFRSESRNVTWRLASVIKYLYNAAATENKTVRLVFDLDANAYYAEETTEKFLLEVETEEMKKEKEKKLKEEALKKERESANKDQNADVSEAKDATSGGSEDKSDERLKPPEPSFGPIDNEYLGTRQIPRNVIIKDIYTSHDSGPVTSGKAYIYFFPSGYAEPAVINFRNEADDKFVSVKLDPFSGSADIAPEYRKLEDEKK